MAIHTLDLKERLKLLRSKQKAYWRANKSEKGRLLDLLQEVTGLGRKTIIRQLRGSCEQRQRSKHRGHKYGSEVAKVVERVDEAYDRPCAERLGPNLAGYAEKLAAHGHLVVSPETALLLEQISISTLRRVQNHVHRDEPRLKRHRGSPNPLASQIPARRIPGDVDEPGHLEVDLVHHSGPHTARDYVHTLHLVDVATGWSEPVGVLGRSFVVVRDGFQRCERRLPFKVLEIHPDNGGEFLNDHMVRYWRQRFTGAELSRSRPYHKDDNPFVEHRNGDLIRRWLGHDRLDSVEQTLALNRFYDKLWVYFNFFHPVMRLIEKDTNPETQKVRRKWDEPRTPYRRLMETKVLSVAKREELERIYHDNDPLTLHRELEREAIALFDLPGARPDRSEDVYSTLAGALQASEREEEATALGAVIN